MDHSKLLYESMTGW